MTDETVAMLKARLEIANQRVEDLENQAALNVLRPRIYTVYADCRWGMKEEWEEARQICRRVSGMFDDAQHTDMIGFAQLPDGDIRDHSITFGNIKLDDDLIPQIDTHGALGIIEDHIETLQSMEDSLGKTNERLAGLNFLLAVARHELETVLGILYQLCLKEVPQTT